MIKLTKLEPVVRNVLKTYPDTRNDDFILIFAVYREMNLKDITREPFWDIMLNHADYKLPSFESITRCRRKIQKEHPELSNKKTQKKRLKATADYIEYNRQ